MKLLLLLLTISASSFASNKLEIAIKSGNHVDIQNLLREAHRQNPFQLEDDVENHTRKKTINPEGDPLEVTPIAPLSLEGLIKLAETQVTQAQQTADKAANFDRLKRGIFGLILLGAGGFKTYTDAVSGVYEKFDANSATQAAASAGFLSGGLYQLWIALSNTDAQAKVASAKAVERDVRTFKNDITIDSAVS